MDLRKQDIEGEIDMITYSKVPEVTGKKDKMHNENFDVEIQYCDPNDCDHDCETASGQCNTHVTSLF